MDIRTQNILSLASGIGGLDLAVRLAVPNARTICYVEREAFPISVLVSKMQEQVLDDAPVWTDVRTFDGATWRGLVDGVIGGYPCQPYSVAGKQRGKDDDRNLTQHVIRIVSEVQPTWCFFENVGAHLRIGFREVKSELESLHYRVTCGLFSAAEVGAPHQRERLFILGYRDDTRGQSSASRVDGYGQAQDERRKELTLDGASGYVCELENSEQARAGCDRRAIGRRVGASDVRQGNGQVGTSGIDTANGEMEDSISKRPRRRDNGHAVSGGDGVQSETETERPDSELADDTCIVCTRSITERSERGESEKEIGNASGDSSQELSYAQRGRRDQVRAERDTQRTKNLSAQARRGELDFLSIPQDPMTKNSGNKSSHPTPKLNPLFVEWLMNLPLRWTDSHFERSDYAHWEMQSSRLLAHLLSAYWQDGRT